MKENGPIRKETVMVSLNGQMGLFTLVIGNKIKQMDRELSNMQMEISIKVNGLMIKQMDLALTYRNQEQNTQGSGKMTYNKVMELRNGKLL